MNQAQQAYIEHAVVDDAAATALPVIIVGAGPVGVHALKELRQSDPSLEVLIYGDEDYQPYNRVQLSGLLAGQFKVSDLSLASELWSESSANTRFLRTRITAIDPVNKTVTDWSGDQRRFSKLILATGSRPFIPAVAGVDLVGVYTFRDMADAEKLAARRVQSTHTVVLGAGLLGIEAARAMQRHNTRVTLVDHNPHPMFRQLDAKAGAMLAEELEARDIALLLGSGLRMLLGTRAVEGIVLRDGSCIACDTVVLATGIRPNRSLAQDAGLAFGRGITVNRRMQTSDEDVYAVGECCECDGEVFGIVAPGFEQASIAVRNIISKEAPTAYRSPQLATSLKVAGLSVFSMGGADHPASVRSFTWQRQGKYRRLTLIAGRIVSINAIGDWPELAALRDLSKKGKWIAPWRLWQFQSSGDLLPAGAANDVESWPAEAIVCNCNSVSAGQIRGAICAGSGTLATLTACTQAGSGCGSCQPLLQELLHDSSPRQKVAGTVPLNIAGFIALVLAVSGLAAYLPYPDTVQLPWRWDELWRNTLLKQISGFTVLGLCAVSLLLSLRKRIPKLQFGQFTHWRSAHVVLTTLALAALAVHTGFRLGDHLNMLLMITFLALVVAGCLLAFSIAWEHKLNPRQARTIRSAGLWSHLLFSWPLPALLGMHILKTYYF